MTGIEFRDTASFIDEIPAAYKDIDQVIADAADLVEIRRTLRQLVNVKGEYPGRQNTIGRRARRCVPARRDSHRAQVRDSTPARISP